MPRDARKYLFDIVEAAKLISQFVAGKTLEDDELVWDIVETRLPVLRREVERIIADKSDQAKT